MNIRTQIAQARRQLASQARTRSRALDDGRAAAWLATARPEQLLPPGDWQTWLLLGGRGSGKTKAAAEATAALVRSGRARRIAVIGRTSDDVRNISIAALEAAVGPSLHYIPSNHNKLVFPTGPSGSASARLGPIACAATNSTSPGPTRLPPSPMRTSSISLTLRSGHPARG